MKNNPRKTALNIIQRTIGHSTYPNVLLDRAFSLKEFPPKDRALITRIVYGVLENKLYLDWVIETFSNIKRDNISEPIRNILRLSVFQLLFLDKVPDFAVVYEGVELTKEIAGPRASGFVNGILRSIVRFPERIRLPSKEKEPSSYISIKYSHARWMVDDWIKIFGRGFTEDLCKANNVIPRMTLRVNTLKTNRQRLMDNLASRDIHTEHGMYCDDALFVKNGLGLFISDAYRDGLFYVQDESSMLAIKALDPKPGELIIDLCSAPGGKATYAAQLMGDSGNIIARDISKNKLNLVRDNYKRLGIRCIETEIHDALRHDPSLEGKGDKVLVDAPCSGLGVIRRKPDIKWNKKRAHYKELAKIQKRILKNAATYVKPGGYLLYCTCTIMPWENQDVIEDFLHGEPGYRLWDFSRALPDKLAKGNAKKGYLQLFPNVHGTDGFFICKLKRVQKT